MKLFKPPKKTDWTALAEQRWRELSDAERANLRKAARERFQIPDEFGDGSTWLMSGCRLILKESLQSEVPE